MITAVFVIVMMATLTALIQNVMGKTIKSTTDQYRKDQAVLLARSYAELAILYVTNYDRNTTNSCLQTIDSEFEGDIDDGGYLIHTEIRYIGKNSEIPLSPSCNDDPLLAGVRLTTLGRLSGNNSFDNSMSLMIDIYVTYQTFDHPNNRIQTFHKRTVQKI